MNKFWDRLLSQKANVCYYCGTAKDGEVLMEVSYMDEGIRVPINAHIACAAGGEMTEPK